MEPPEEQIFPKTVLLVNTSHKTMMFSKYFFGFSALLFIYGLCPSKADVCKIDPPEQFNDIEEWGNDGGARSIRKACNLAMKNCIKEQQKQFGRCITDQFEGAINCDDECCKFLSLDCDCGECKNTDIYYRSKNGQKLSKSECIEWHLDGQCKKKSDWGESFDTVDGGVEDGHVKCKAEADKCDNWFMCKRVKENCPPGIPIEPLDLPPLDITPEITDDFFDFEFPSTCLYTPPFPVYFDNPGCVFSPYPSPGPSHTPAPQAPSGAPATASPTDEPTSGPAASPSSGPVAMPSAGPHS